MSSGNRGANWSADPKDPIQPLNLVVIDKPVNMDPGGRGVIKSVCIDGVPVY